MPRTILHSGLPWATRRMPRASAPASSGWSASPAARTRMRRIVFLRWDWGSARASRRAGRRCGEPVNCSISGLSNRTQMHPHCSISGLSKRTLMHPECTTRVEMHKGPPFPGQPPYAGVCWPFRSWRGRYMNSVAFTGAVLTLGELLLGLGHFDGDIALVLVEAHSDLVAFLHVLVDDLFGHRVLDVLLDRALQRACAELLIVAFLAEEILGLIGQLQVVAQFADALVHIAQLNVDDLVDVLALERVEHDDVVDAVQELRCEGLLQGFLHDPAVGIGGSFHLGLGAEAHAAAVFL